MTSPVNSGLDELNARAAQNNVCVFFRFENFRHVNDRASVRRFERDGRLELSKRHVFKNGRFVVRGFGKLQSHQLAIPHRVKARVGETQFDIGARDNRVPVVRVDVVGIFAFGRVGQTQPIGCKFDVPTCVGGSGTGGAVGAGVQDAAIITAQKIPKRKIRRFILFSSQPCPVPPHSDRGRKNAVEPTAHA